MLRRPLRASRIRTTMTRVTASEHRDRPERRTLWSRRRLLATAVLAGVGAAFESAGSTSERHRVRQKFGGYPMGVHGASLRAFPNEELAEIVAVDLELHWLELTAAQIRLEDVERGRDAGPAASLQEVRKLRELLESSDITPTAFGLVRFAGDKESNQELFSRAQCLGIRNFSCIPELSALDDLERLADEFGIRLAIHNNAPGEPVAPFDTIADVLAAVEGRGPNVGACLDIGNALRGSEDPAEAVQRLGSRLIGIHLKDVSARDPDSDVIVLGKGFLDVPAFFAALREVGFPDDGALSLEYLEKPDDPLPGIREGLQIAAAATNA